MSHIRFFINKEIDTLAVSFDAEEAAVFPLHLRTFADKPTYEDAHAWFYDEGGYDLNTATQEALSTRYCMTPVSVLGNLTEL